MVEVHTGALKPGPLPPALGALPPCYEKPMPHGDLTEGGQGALFGTQQTPRWCQVNPQPCE